MGIVHSSSSSVSTFCSYNSLRADLENPVLLQNSTVFQSSFPMPQHTKVMIKSKIKVPAKI